MKKLLFFVMIMMFGSSFANAQTNQTSQQVQVQQRDQQIMQNEQFQKDLNCIKLPAGI